MDSGALAAAVSAGVERFGGLDGVVNVAAYDAVMGTLLDMDADTFRQVLEVNVYGSTNLVRAAVPALKTSGGGAVVLIGSQSAMKSNPVHRGCTGHRRLRCCVARDLANDLGPTESASTRLCRAGCGGRTCRCTASGRRVSVGSSRRTSRTSWRGQRPSSDGGRYRRRRIGDVLPLRSQLDDYRTAPG